MSRNNTEKGGACTASARQGSGGRSLRQRWHPQVRSTTQAELALHFRRRPGRQWYLLAAALLLAPLLLMRPADARSGENEQNEALPQDMQTGSLLLQMQSGYVTATRINTEVEITVSGPVARTIVKQRFRNDGSEWVEGVYVFPLPDTAAVDRMRIQAGERVIEGVIREKEQARTEYEQAKKSGARAGLVEQQRTNLFTTSIANLSPGETVSVEIEYLQTVPYDDGLFSLRFPLSVTPRYIPGTPSGRQGSGWSADTDSVPDASLITPPVVTQSQDHRVGLRVRIDAGVPLANIESRYHPVTVTEAEGASNRFDVALAESSVPMDHDFELTWRAVAGSMPRAVLFRENVDQLAHYLLMVLPPDEAGAGAPMHTPPMPRELVFVVDTSGSMHGVSMEQARQVLLLALDGLRATDRFNVIQFNSVTSELFPQSVAASPGNVGLAANYIRSLAANGGTEMRPALERALTGAEAGEHLRQIIFVTDGSVGNEQELFSLIDRRLGNSRLFTVGIGSAPNSLFMRKAAEAGRGTYTFISALHEVRERMEGLVRKLEHPRLTGIEVEWPETALAYPQIVPDLYAGAPIVQKVRLAAAPQNGDQVRISGTSPAGDWGVDLPVAAERINPGIAAIWARARIEHLEDSERQGADADEVRAAVVETALAHHLVSRHTSLVAVDRTPVRPQSSSLDSEQVPTLLPYGQSQRAIFGFPATATGWAGNVALGAFLMLVALGMLVATLYFPGRRRVRAAP
jgi:Ca-activated chloride channel homolog